MKGPTPRRMRKYAAKCLSLKSYFQHPGDGRSQGRIPATALLWALLMGTLLCRTAFAGIEASAGQVRAGVGVDRNRAAGENGNGVRI